MTVGFFTLGCKVNQVDSQTLAQWLVNAGYTRAEPEIADVVVINSCTVTAESERKTRQRLRHFRVLNRNCILVITGCAVQVGDDTALRYPEADLILGQQDARDLLHYIDKFLLNRQQIISISARQRDEAIDTLSYESDIRTRATIKIEDGCDSFCSYCIIPHARGPVRSKPLADLRKEIKTLADQGFREVVLAGINLGAYGSDLGYHLSDAVLTTAEAVEGTPLQRIRLGSLEPDCMTDSLLETLSCVKSLCPHFHLSLQSGCDHTLKRMNRQYSTKEYFSIVNRLRTHFPDAAITTDIMVGFPGESDEEFSQSLAFAEQIGFANMHVFPFSPRQGTPAASFAGQITKTEKKKRATQMLLLAQTMRHNFLNSQIGKTLEVLLEEPFSGGGMQGYSANYTPIIISDANPQQQNQLVLAQITVVNENHCIGLLTH